VKTIRAGLTARHPLIGPANCYEMPLMMALHPPRHAPQIDEIREVVRAAESAAQGKLINACPTQSVGDKSQPASPEVGALRARHAGVRATGTDP